jgi:hypothetical protein
MVFENPGFSEEVAQSQRPESRTGHVQDVGVADQPEKLQPTRTSNNPELKGSIVHALRRCIRNKNDFD